MLGGLAGHSGGVLSAPGARSTPYAFFSVKKNPSERAEDLVGKKVGIQATGVILLRACSPRTRFPKRTCRS
jgi:NitT/TauT family transport system substrate-binding protein